MQETEVGGQMTQYKTLPYLPPAFHRTIHGTVPPRFMANRKRRLRTMSVHPNHCMNSFTNQWATALDASTKSNSISGSARLDSISV